MRIFNLKEGIEELDLESYKSLIEGDYSDAYKLVQEGNVIYKGMYEIFQDQPYFFTRIKNRQSANVPNYYTLWINNHDDWARFPNRNVIGTTSEKFAEPYGFFTLVILPKNGTKIGVCPSDDIWYSFPVHTIMDKNVVDVLELFERLFEYYYNEKPTTYNQLIKFLSNMKITEEDVQSLDVYPDMADIIQMLIKNNPLDVFQKLFYPKGFDIVSMKDIRNINNKEVWFDGDFIGIPLDDFKKFVPLSSTLNESVSDYDNWTMHDEETLKSDFDEYQFKEERKWKDRAERMGFRYPIFPTFESYKHSIENGEVVELSDDRWDEIENLSKNSSLDSINDMVNGYTVPRDVERIKQGIENDSKIPYPVILKGTNGYHIMSGNTRINTARVLGVTPKVLILDVSE